MSRGSLQSRIEMILEPHDPVTGRVLGGVGFFVEGRLVVAALDTRLCLRGEAADSEPGLCRPLLFAGRPVTGWMTIEEAELDDNALTHWVERALSDRGPAI